MVTYDPVVFPSVATDAMLSRVYGGSAEQVNGQRAAQAGHSFPSCTGASCQERRSTVWQQKHVSQMALPLCLYANIAQLAFKMVDGAITVQTVKCSSLQTVNGDFQSSNMPGMCSKTAGLVPTPSNKN